MQRTLLSLASLGTLAASLSAQCVAPSGTQSIVTTLAGNYIYGSCTPVNGALIYGVSQDPGPAVRCDLTVGAAVSVSTVSLSLFDDGTTIAGCIPTSNLIGTPGNQVEMWINPGATVTNSAIYGAYTRNTTPPVAPPAGWTLAGTGVLNVAAQGVASVATFTPPIALPAGTYAVELVMVAPYALPPGTDQIRHHTRMIDTPSTGQPLVTQDQFLKIEHSGITGTAFSVGALNHLTAAPGPFVADMGFGYTVTATNLAYSTKYGAGCYDRKLTFYQSFIGAPNATGSVPSAVAAHPVIELLPIGAPPTNYLVQAGAGAYPLHGPVGAGTDGSRWFDLNRVGQPSHVNTIAPGGSGSAGDWDDSNSVVYDLPFTINYPSGAATQMVINSNGAIYLGATASSGAFRRSTTGWLIGPPVFAAGFQDWWPFDGPLLSGGTGEIYCETDGSTWLTVSFVNTMEYPNAGYGTTGNNWQVEFSNTGSVKYAYGQFATSDSSVTVIGFTPGNGAPDSGSGAHPRSAPSLVTLPFLSGDGAKPSSISLPNRPKVGNTLNISTSNLDSASVQVLTFVSFNSFAAPGVPTGWSPSGCNLLIQLPEQFLLVDPSFGGPSVSPSLGTIPLSAAGLTGYAQSAQINLSSPLYNNPFGAGFGVLLSDAVCIHVDVN